MTVPLWALVAVGLFALGLGLFGSARCENRLEDLQKAHNRLLSLLGYTPSDTPCVCGLMQLHATNIDCERARNSEKDALMRITSAIYYIDSLPLRDKAMLTVHRILTE